MRVRFLIGMTLMLCSSALPAGQGRSGQDAPARQDFDLINKTGFTVVAFTATPSKKGAPEPDLLSRKVVRNGETTRIAFPSGAKECRWNLKATYDDGDTTEMREVDLCEVATVTLNP